MTCSRDVAGEKAVVLFAMLIALFALVAHSNNIAAEPSVQSSSVEVSRLQVENTVARALGGTQDEHEAAYAHVQDILVSPQAPMAVAPLIDALRGPQSEEVDRALSLLAFVAARNPADAQPASMAIAQMIMDDKWIPSHDVSRDRMLWILIAVPPWPNDESVVRIADALLRERRWNVEGGWAMLSPVDVFASMQASGVNIDVACHAIEDYLTDLIADVGVEGEFPALKILELVGSLRLQCIDVGKLGRDILRQNPGAYEAVLRTVILSSPNKDVVNAVLDLKAPGDGDSATLRAWRRLALSVVDEGERDMVHLTEGVQDSPLVLAAIASVTDDWGVFITSMRAGLSDADATVEEKYRWLRALNGEAMGVLPVVAAVVELDFARIDPEIRAALAQYLFAFLGRRLENPRLQLLLSDVEPFLKDDEYLVRRPLMAVFDIAYSTPLEYSDVNDEQFP